MEKEKEKTFSKIENITIVGLSKWLQNSAKKSSLLENKKVINLPNPIDTDKFNLLIKKKQESFGIFQKIKSLCFLVL